MTSRPKQVLLSLVLLIVFIFAVTCLTIVVVEWRQSSVGYSKSLWGDGVSMGTNGVVTNK